MENAISLATSLIKRFEGCVLKAYRDVVGVLTIGYGHTGNVQPNEEINNEEANALLISDASSAEQAVYKLIPIKLTEHEKAALIDFVFNLGYNRLRSSTLRHLLLQHNYEGAALEFNKWIYAGGRRYPGLILRRAAETSMFKTSD